MRYRACFSIVLLATAAACAAVSEGPTAPPSLAVAGGGKFSSSEPPPPPLDTQMVDVDGGSGTFNFQSVSARYLANKSDNNAWIAFFTGEFVRASANARLQYHEQSGKTNGKGVLTDTRTGATLDLSRVSIVTGQFGPCDGSGGGEVVIDGPTRGDSCGEATFTVAGGTPGSLTVRRRPAVAAVD